LRRFGDRAPRGLQPARDDDQVAALRRFARERELVAHSVGDELPRLRLRRFPRLGARARARALRDELLHVRPDRNAGDPVRLDPGFEVRRHAERRVVAERAQLEREAEDRLSFAA
jgi:hypothetical protein